MVYVLLADGFEEVEALAPTDVLRRAEIPVMTAGVGGDVVRGAHSVNIICDTTVDEIEKDSVDGIILPGGMPGTLNLQADKKVNELIEYCKDNELMIAAICAAPMILGELGILDGKAAVCFPGFEEHLHGAEICDCYVVSDDNVITARGAGAALEFGEAIVDYFAGLDGSGREILEQMQYPLI